MILTIACDVDGVVADLDQTWLDRYNKDYDDSVTPAMITEWDMLKFVKPECGVRIFDYLTDPKLYDAVAPYDDAKQGVANLRALGHNVLFTTACTYGMVDGKARFLVRNNFAQAQTHNKLPYEFVAVQDKAHVRAHLMIDDGPHNVVRWVDTGRPAILVARPHNADFIKKLRQQQRQRQQQQVRVAHDWAEIVTLVKRIVDWAPAELPSTRRR